MKKSSRQQSSPLFPSSVTKVTMFSRFLVLFLLILLPLAGFYIGLNYQQLFDSQATALNIQPIGTPSAKMQPTAILFLRTSDNGKSFSIPQGTHINFALGSSMHWRIASSNLSVVNNVDRSALEFVALQSGTVILSATGTPICKIHAPCPLFAAVFKVTITVK